MNLITFGLGGRALITMGLGIAVARGGYVRTTVPIVKIEFVDKPVRVRTEAIEGPVIFDSSNPKISFTPRQPKITMKDRRG